jgi:hypothetical protein
MSYTVGGHYNFPNLLQLWCVSKHSNDPDSGNDGVTDNGSNSRRYESDKGGPIMINSSHLSGQTLPDFSNTEVKLAYCIGMDRGPCWKVVWSNWKPFRRKGDEDNNLLGILAVVCGDGSCLVFVLPRSLSTVSSTALPTNGCTDSIADKVVVIPESSVCRWELKVPSEKGSLDNISIISAAWNPQDPFQLSCGLADGSVAVYNLDPELLSPPSLSSPPPPQISPPTPQLSAQQQQHLKQFLSSSLATSSHITSQTLSNVSFPSSSSYLPDSKKKTIEVSKTLSESRSRYYPVPNLYLKENTNDNNNVNHHNHEQYLGSKSNNQRTNRKRRHSNDLSSNDERPISNAVRAVSYCPVNPHLLLSAGYGSDVKVSLDHCMISSFFFE